ncbi:hypothetical protein C8R45DRAFT_1105883 [Mycena sanguinolenta]|nr:hypothetical protein C8R45DRAFT_1105883 [Mycena sanguinolenta]
MPPTCLATISELASAAAENPPSPGHELKYYLWLAEEHRKAGTAHMARASSARGELGGERGGGGEEEEVEAMVLWHMQRAFIELMRAGTLVVETIPMHQDYAAELTGAQKANLTEKGHNILDNLGMLRAVLVDPYDEYSESAAASSEVVSAVMAVNEQSSNTREADAAVETKPSAVLTCGICFDTLSCPVVWDTVYARLL